MVPETYVNLKVFPLTSNGKLDYKALPQPGIAHAGDEAKCMEPRDAVEAFLKQIWAAVVGAGNFSIRDDFFTIGGNSLRAAVLCTRIGEAFGRHVPVSFVFDKTTIEHQATFLRDESFLTVPESLVPIQRRGSRRPLFCVHPYFGLAHCYLRGTSLAKMNEVANRMGAWVASHAGGTPVADASKLAELQSLAT